MALPLYVAPTAYAFAGGNTVIDILQKQIRLDNNTLVEQFASDIKTAVVERLRLTEKFSLPGV